jgi:hypothetical protein
MERNALRCLPVAGSCEHGNQPSGSINPSKFLMSCNKTVPIKVSSYVLDGAG